MKALLKELSENFDTKLQSFLIKSDLTRNKSTDVDEICYSSGGHDELRNIPQAVCTRDEIPLKRG